MTIEFVKGDLFESGCEALVNPCNAHGAMGAGLALLFKRKYPHYFLEYRRDCWDGVINAGRVREYYNPNCKPNYLFSFATKDHWRNKSKLEWIESGLPELCRLVTFYGIKSVAVPALGAGLGGLEWQQVKPLMVEAFERHPDVLFRIYEPLEQ